MGRPGDRASPIVRPVMRTLSPDFMCPGYNGPHFYCWSGSWAQLKVNRSGLTRDDQAQAGPGHSSGRSESLTGLGVSSGWAGHLVPVWTNQRPDTRVTGQSEAASIPRVARIRPGVQAWTSANICSKYFSFSTEFYEISFFKCQEKV